MLTSYFLAARPFQSKNLYFSYRTAEPQACFLVVRDAIPVSLPRDVGAKPGAGLSPSL